MAKATDKTTGDNATETTDTTQTVTAQEAPKAPEAPKASKEAPHPWDKYKDQVNGLTRYNGKARGE